MYEAELRRAMELAREAKGSGDRPYGALILGEDGQVLAEGRSRVVREGLSTRHAVLCAIENAQRHLDRTDLSGCTLVSSAEPCPMCAGAAHWARLSRVVFGVSMERLAETPAGHDQLVPGVREVLEGETLEVLGPLLEEEALQAML